MANKTSIPKTLNGSSGKTTVQPTSRPPNGGRLLQESLLQLQEAKKEAENKGYIYD